MKSEGVVYFWGMEEWGAGVGWGGAVQK
jgi:hypothetical protein